MEPWQKRVVDEYEELVSRLEKLDSFLENVDNLPKVDPLLVVQRDIMMAYATVLNQRIVKFDG